MILYLSLLDSKEDQHKFVQLYNTYRYIMMYTADRILNDHQLAEDAVHDAFIRIARNLNKVETVDSPQTKAFVVIIVRNVALSTAKLRNKTFILDDENTISAIADSTNDKDFNNMNYSNIVKAIKELPDTYKDALYLNVVEEYSVKEISEMLEISSEAVKKRLQRGRKMLIDKIRKDGIADV